MKFLLKTSFLIFAIFFATVGEAKSSAVKTDYKKNPGQKERYESEGWNSHWKAEFGLAKTQLSNAQISHLDKLNSDWLRCIYYITVSAL